jgi:hypothetical protein
MATRNVLRRVPALLAVLAACTPNPAHRSPGPGDLDAASPATGGAGGGGSGGGGSGGNSTGGSGGNTTGGAGGSASGGSGGNATGGTGGSATGGTGGSGGRGMDAAAGGGGGADAALPVDMRPASDLAPDAPAAIAGLVAHWRLDEGQGTSASDDTEFSNDATLQNGATFRAGGFPGARFANPFSVALDGVDDFVDITNRALPAVDVVKTIACWVRYDAIPGSGNQAFVDFYNSSARAGVEMGFRGSRLVVWGYGGGEIVGGTPPAPGWHHLAYTFDGTTHALFVDGTRVQTSTMAAQVGPVVTAHLGAHGSTGAEAFRGVVDDVRVYGRALASGEIATLATGGE